MWRIVLHVVMGAGGAMAGFVVFGVVGAAIGGVVGLILPSVLFEILTGL